MAVTDIIDFDTIGAQAEALRAEFAQTGRMRIRDFLKAEVCADLHTTLRALDWRLVLNDAHGRHVDLPPSQQKRLGGKELRRLKHDAQKRSLSGFQYLYENYPLYDRIEGRQKVPAPLGDIYMALNDPAFIEPLGDMTAKPFDFCDIQATRYRAGHMLTDHDDNVAGKNRHCAYVLSVCPDWQRKWGGNLEFLDADGAVTERFTPGYNVLSVFSVPMAHRVSPVRKGVLASRYSLTGWLRSR